jgi:hypothetical protein
MTELSDGAFLEFADSGIYAVAFELGNLSVIRAQRYKTFYNCILQIFLISYSVCPCQVFPALSDVCQ